LIERRYVSVLTKQDSGVYKYESQAQGSTDQQRARWPFR